MSYLVGRGFIPRAIRQPKERSLAESEYIRRIVDSKLPAVMVRGKKAAPMFYSALYDLLKAETDTRIVASSDVTTAMMDDARLTARLGKVPCLGVTLGFDLTRDIHEKVLASLAYGRVSSGLRTVFLFPFDTIRRLEGAYGTTFTDLQKDGYLEFVEVKP